MKKKINPYVTSWNPEKFIDLYGSKEKLKSILVISDSAFNNAVRTRKINKVCYENLLRKGLIGSELGIRKPMNLEKLEKAILEFETLSEIAKELDVQVSSLSRRLAKQYHTRSLDAIRFKIRKKAKK